MAEVPGQASSLGFAVIYRWRLLEGFESRFLEAWTQVTAYLRDHQGALGSRLHRCDDGTLLAYAQWPSREAWQAMQDAPSGIPEASRIMGECIEESFESQTMEPLHDLLLQIQ